MSSCICSRVKAFQRAEWLIHQQHARIGSQRPGNAHAQLHAARQFIDLLFAQSGEADLFQQAFSPPQTLRLRHAP